MQENFLHFIWKFQYFQHSDLHTDIDFEEIEVVSPGVHNHNAGPDFLNAHIRINQIDWYGHVEIHITSKDWNRHQHHLDQAYDNVILHVVWDNNTSILRNDATKIPTLTLNERVDTGLINRYKLLFDRKSIITCSPQFDQVLRIHKVSMIDRALMERIERKSHKVLNLLKEKKRDWEECTYQLLAEYFGFKINNTAFQRLSQIIPLKILKLHAYQPLQIEALLFGSAGLLPKYTTSIYEKKLITEYKFLSHKYGIKEKQMLAHEWRYLRLRPANFPTIRIAQLATIVTNIPHLCSAFLHISSKESFYRFMQYPTSEYWHTHYQFQKTASKKINPHIGKSALQSLLINVVVPLQFAYGIDQEENRYKEKAITLLESIPPEKNKITQEWNALSINNNSSLDSQGLIELYTQYCNNSRCLECAIGLQILKGKNKH